MMKAVNCEYCFRLFLCHCPFVIALSNDEVGNMRDKRSLTIISNPFERFFPIRDMRTNFRDC